MGIQGTTGTQGATYSLSTATGNQLGGIKIGSGVNITADGTISVAGGGGGGLTNRNSISITASNLPPLSATSATLSGWKSYALLSIETSAAAWVTLYSSVANKNTDWSRSILTDPAFGSGVISEVISTQSGKTLFTPSVIGFSSENTPSTDIPIKIYNMSTNTTLSVVVTATILKLEN